METEKEGNKRFFLERKQSFFGTNTVLSKTEEMVSFLSHALEYVKPLHRGQP